MRKRPRDQQSLALTTRERIDALRNERLHAHRHGLEIGIEPRQTCDLPGAVDRQLGSAADVFIDAAGGEPRVLQHDTDLIETGPDLELQTPLFSSTRTSPDCSPRHTNGVLRNGSFLQYLVRRLTSAGFVSHANICIAGASSSASTSLREIAPA